MITLGRIVVALAVLLAAGPPGHALGGELPRHSGLVVAVDDEVGTFALAEVGPWQRRNGETVVTRRNIVVTDETRFLLVRRVDRPPSGYPRDYVAQDLAPWGLDEGDFITVECRHERGRLLAITVLVVDILGD